MFLVTSKFQIQKVNASMLIFEGVKRHCLVNRPFSYSKKECGSNDISSHFVEFSNVYNTDRRPNAIQSNLVYKNNARSRLFCRIAKRSIVLR